jgi:hypothetical protein
VNLAGFEIGALAVALKKCLRDLQPPFFPSAVQVCHVFLSVDFSVSPIV